MWLRWTQTGNAQAYGISVRKKTLKRQRGEMGEQQRNEFSVYCTAHYNTITQHKPTKCTFFKLIF